MCSHLVKVDKVDIQRLVRLTRLQQILILVLVLLGKKDETGGLDDGIITAIVLSL